MKKSYILLFTLVIFFSLNTVIGQSWPSGAHDPSSIIKEGNRYWVFSTGDGIYMKYSDDLVTWSTWPDATDNENVLRPFKKGTFPNWILNYAKNSNGQFEGFFWAPDIIYMNNQYYLYYSASVWGSANSCIGLVTNKTLNPTSPEYKWVDQGNIGIYSPKAGWSINAIDPSLMRGPDGKIWMTYGSFNLDGIMVTEIDSVSGKPTGATVPVANSWTGGSAYGEGEGGCMIYHDEYYYMFYNKGGCCAGIGSSYYIVTGRSKNPQGPFYDKNGIIMRKVNAKSGGTVVFRHDDSRGEDDRYYGPGHFGWLKEDSIDFVSFHYYDPNGYYPNDKVGNKGGPTQGLAFLKWDEDGWPSISMDFLDEGVYTLTNVNSGKALDVKDHNASTGAVAFQYDKDLSLKTQQWYFNPLGTGEYTIQNVADQTKYLETASLTSSTVQLTDNYTGAINQKWRIVKDNKGQLIIYPSIKDVMLEVPNAFTQDYQVKLFRNTNHPTQRWIAEGLPSFIIPNTNITVSSNGTVKDSLKVVTDQSWTVSVVDPSWLLVLPQSGKGNETITLIANENLSTDTRQNILSIKSESGTSIIVYINQEGAEPEPIVNALDDDINYQIFPNPTSGMVEICTVEPVQVAIYNQAGMLIQSTMSPSNQHLINLSNQPIGLYIVKISTDKKTWTEKIVKK